MNPSLEVQIIAILVAISCAIPGVFLVLKKQAMMSDAISHTILLGIVIGFLFVRDLNSIYLIIGAAFVGLLTVFLTEGLIKTRIVSPDSSIGIISPLLFSIGILLIGRFASNVHLDLDSVLLGELAFAPFDRLVIFGKDFGAKSIYIMGLILIINIIFILLYYKELKLSTFDTSFAVILGFSPVIINYVFMGLISVTAVSAFNAVGSILVIAFMVGPPITAYLITQDLKKMIYLSAFFGIINSIIGYQISVLFDISIAGSMASMTGLIFLLTLFFSPKDGIVIIMVQRAKQKQTYTLYAMLFHLYNHEDTTIEQEEASVKTIASHLNWNKSKLNKMIYYGKRQGFIAMYKGIIKLTECGRKYTLLAYQELIDSI